MNNGIIIAAPLSAEQASLLEQQLLNNVTSIGALLVIEPERKTNHLISIGYTGNRYCYLNVSREEAIRRYTAIYPEYADVIEDKEKDGPYIAEFDFTDEFGTYDVYQ